MLGRSLRPLCVCADIEEGSSTVIPLPNVSGSILSKVIEYCKFHVDAEKKVRF